MQRQELLVYKLVGTVSVVLNIVELHQAYSITEQEKEKRIIAILICIKEVQHGEVKLVLV